MVARYAFVLRGYISDVLLLNRGPIAKDRRLEVVLALRGLKSTLQHILKNRQNVDYTETIRSIQVLYPLIPRTIPASQKVEGLQSIVQEISMDFTKLAFAVNAFLT